MAFPWGVWFEPVQPVARIVELARLAEREGAEVCFLADEGTDRDLYVALTAVALGTERMIVAPAITNPFSRHPVTTAAAIATLAELVPGRVWHGLGVGGSRVLAPLGLVPERPYTALRDAFELNRSASSGAARSARPGCPGRRSRCRSRSPGAAVGCRRSRPPKPTGSCCPPRRRPRSRARLIDSARTAARSRGRRTSRTRPSNGSACSATSPTWRSTRRRRSASAPASPTSASARSAPRCCPDASTRPPRSSPTRWSTSTRSPARPTTVRGGSPPSRRASTCSCSR